MGESISRSVGLFKKTWGETVVGGASLGVAGFCAWVTLVALTGPDRLDCGTNCTRGVLCRGYFLMVLFSALQGVFVASLFRYASGGGTTPGFDNELLEQAFVPKRR